MRSAMHLLILVEVHGVITQEVKFMSKMKGTLPSWRPESAATATVVNFKSGQRPRLNVNELSELITMLMFLFFFLLPESISQYLGAGRPWQSY